MVSDINIKRGAAVNLPILDLAEFGFTTDTKELYIGNGIGNTHFTSEQFVLNMLTTLSGIKSSLAGLNVSTSTPYIMTTTFVDISFTTNIFQNKPNIIELDSINTNRVLIKETGSYFVGYGSVVTVQGSGTAAATTNLRLAKNGDTVIFNSTHSVKTYPSETHATSNSIIIDLVAGDYLTSQISRGSEAAITASESRLLLLLLANEQGPKGDTGAGSNVTIQSNGVAVTGTPHSTLNFIGPTITNIGGGTVNIIGGFITEISSDALSSTTSNVYQNKLTTTLNLSAGKYKISFYYEWGYSSASANFQGRLTVNDTVVASHIQEPKDTNAAQSHNVSGFYYYTGSGNTVINLDYCSGTNGQTSRIKNARIDVWRVQ